MVAKSNYGTVKSHNNKNVTSDKIKELSNTQHRLRIEKESCQDRDQKTLLQNKRNKIKKGLKISSSKKGHLNFFK